MNNICVFACFWGLVCMVFISHTTYFTILADHVFWSCFPAENHT